MKFRIENRFHYSSGKIGFYPMIKKGFWNGWRYINKNDTQFNISYVYKESLANAELAKQIIHDYIINIYLPEGLEIKINIVK